MAAGRVPELAVLCPRRASFSTLGHPPLGALWRVAAASSIATVNRSCFSHKRRRRSLLLLAEEVPAWSLMATTKVLQKGHPFNLRKTLEVVVVGEGRGRVCVWGREKEGERGGAVHRYRAGGGGLLFQLDASVAPAWTRHAGRPRHDTTSVAILAQAIEILIDSSKKLWKVSLRCLP